MFRREESGKLYPRCICKNVDAALTAFIACGVIRNQPNAFSTNEMKRIAHQYGDARPDSRMSRRGLSGESRCERDQEARRNGGLMRNYTFLQVSAI
jgi:hypothetical protein